MHRYVLIAGLVGYLALDKYILLSPENRPVYQYFQLKVGEFEKELLKSNSQILSWRKVVDFVKTWGQKGKLNDFLNEIKQQST